MKILILIFALIAPQSIFAEPGSPYLYSKPKRSATITGTLGDGIPASYSASNPKSKVLSGLERYGHLKVWNSCATPIYVNANYSNSVAPANGDSGNSFVPATSGIIEDNEPIAGVIYIRSFGAALENCYVTVEVW